MTLDDAVLVSRVLRQQALNLRSCAANVMDRDPAEMFDGLKRDAYFAAMNAMADRLYALAQEIRASVE